MSEEIQDLDSETPSLPPENPNLPAQGQEERQVESTNRPQDQSSALLTVLKRIKEAVSVFNEYISLQKQATPLLEAIKRHREHVVLKLEGFDRFRGQETPQVEFRNRTQPQPYSLLEAFGHIRDAFKSLNRHPGQEAQLMEDLKCIENAATIVEEFIRSQVTAKELAAIKRQQDQVNPLSEALKYIQEAARVNDEFISLQKQTTVLLEVFKRHDREKGAPLLESMERTHDQAPPPSEDLEHAQAAMREVVKGYHCFRHETAPLFKELNHFREEEVPLREAIKNLLGAPELVEVMDKVHAKLMTYLSIIEAEDQIRSRLLKIRNLTESSSSQAESMQTYHNHPISATGSQDLLKNTKKREDEGHASISHQHLLKKPRGYGK